MSTTTETRQFQAETRQLLDLMIHSIYSNKEIFLRELISNASDAIDKLRFLAIENPELTANDQELEIKIDPDSENRELKIIDNGIGMNRDEVIDLIGTIAKSGTKEVLEKLKADKKPDAELIGQFGVGFYSAFIVAEEVTLITRKAGETTGVKWVSKGDGTYTIEEVAKPNRGTEIILKLKPEDMENGMSDFTQTWELERIIKKYSDFIAYPVRVHIKPEKKEDGSEAVAEEWKIVNSQKPIWTRSKNDVKEEEYNEFYKHISHDFQEPLKTIPYKAEGRIEYSALLYIPQKIPFDYYFQNYKSGLQLYVKKVMISDAVEELLPKYMRFVRGVVDSSDLSLNISREILQQDRQIAAIRKGLTSKLASTFKEMLEKDRENYEKFWKEFGITFKEGITSDFENKDKLMNLLLFQSSLEKDKLFTLKDYVGRMHPDQKEIYYITGENRELLENSPHVEKVLSRGFEVLYLTDPVDDFVMQHVTEFEGKKFQSIGSGDLHLGDEESKKKSEKKVEETGKKHAYLLAKIKEILKDNVKEVKVTDRLVSAPACLTGEGYDMSLHIEKLLKRNGESTPSPRRVLELNPEHAIFKKMAEKFTQNADDADLPRAANVLLGYAVLAEGGDLPNPAAFNREIVSLLDKAL